MNFMMMKLTTTQTKQMPPTRPLKKKHHLFQVLELQVVLAFLAKLPLIILHFVEAMNLTFVPW